MFAVVRAVRTNAIAVVDDDVTCHVPTVTCREHLLRTARQYNTDALDGLSSLVGYSINVQHRKLFTRFYVDINQKSVMAAAAAAARNSGEYIVSVYCLNLIVSLMLCSKPIV